MIKGYLNNASTTETKFFAKDFYIPGNPNSPTAIGRKAHDELTKTRERIKEHFGVKGGKVIIGGTASQLIEKVISQFESQPTWLFESAYEHDCIDSYFGRYGRSFKTKETLKADLEMCREWSAETPAIVAWMLTNNITGTIFDVKSIGELCHKYGAYYIMDCTASIGHNSIPEGVEDYCDCLITSAHKYHGPSGIGCMWVSDRFANFLGLTDDDHDEYGLIPGTPDVSGAVAMECAMDHVMDVFKQDDMWHEYDVLTTDLHIKLKANNIVHKFVEYYENWSNPNMDTVYTPAINAITLPGFNADALVQFLSSRGVYISAGHSACSGDSPDASRVLEAFGLSKEEASQTVRISFCEDSTISDIDMLVDGIVEFKEKFM